MRITSPALDPPSFTSHTTRKTTMSSRWNHFWNCVKEPFIPMYQQHSLTSQHFSTVVWPTFMPQYLAYSLHLIWHQSWPEFCNIAILLNHYVFFKKLTSVSLCSRCMYGRPGETARWWNMKKSCWSWSRIKQIQICQPWVWLCPKLILKEILHSSY